MVAWWGDISLRWAWGDVPRCPSCPCVPIFPCPHPVPILSICPYVPILALCPHLHPHAPTPSPCPHPVCMSLCPHSVSISPSHPHVPMSPSRCPHVPIPSHLGPNPQLHSQTPQQPAGNAFGNAQLAVILGVINNNNQTGGWVEVSPWPRDPPLDKNGPLCVCVWGGRHPAETPILLFQWVKALKETSEARSPKLSSSRQTKRCFGELLLGFSQSSSVFFLHILTDATLHTPRSLTTTDPTVGPSGAQSSTGTAPGARPRHRGRDGGRGCGGAMRGVGPPQRGLGQGPSWPARP